MSELEGMQVSAQIPVSGCKPPEEKEDVHNSTQNAGSGAGPEAGTAEEAGEEGAKEGSLLRRVASLPKKLIVIGCGLAGLAIVAVMVVTLLQRVNPKEEDGPDWMDDAELEMQFSYTAEEVRELRDNGYTGDEIERYQTDEVSASELVEEAKARRRALYEEELAPYKDATSEEFKTLLSNTWAGGEELTYDGNVEMFERYSTTMNVDYVRLPARGSQLWLKLLLESGRVLFMSVTPEQYDTYRESGNIVVYVEYTVTGDGALIVTNMTEVVP